MSKTITYDTHLNYGSGVDSSTEQPRGTAVIPAPPKKLAGAAGVEVIYSTHLCDDQRSLEESLGVSAAMSVTYGFTAGASAKVDFAQSKLMTAHSLCIIVKATVTNPVLLMDNIHLDTDAKKLYTSNPDEFKARFGDMYVNGVHTGGELFGILMMTSKSEQDKSGSVRS